LRDIPGVILITAWVFGVLGVSGWLKKRGVLGVEGSRKLVHVGVSNSWILALLTIRSHWFFSVPLLLFSVLNFVSYRKGVFQGMERGQGKADLGTVYFPLSMGLLAMLTWWNGLLVQNPLVGSTGALAMGFGDGLAAVVGQKWGKRFFQVGKSRKSVEGSLTMFCISLGVFLLLGFAWPGGAWQGAGALGCVGIMLLSALVATLVEAITPYGFDNLSVPFVVSAFFGWLCWMAGGLA